MARATSDSLDQAIRRADPSFAGDAPGRRSPMVGVKPRRVAHGVDKSEHTARAKALARARRAVKRFVRLAAMYEDFLDLHAPESRDNEPVKRAFYELERAVWRSEGWLEPPDTSRLVQALLSSVPAKHREGVSKAFGKVEGATVATALVREQAAYMIGLAMGRRVVD